MAVGTLYVEELKATMRGRFAWLGAGVMLLAVGCVATVGTQDTWLDGYGIIAYFLVPDRKSTRLNSSHVAISYAVFCLKKKIIISCKPIMARTCFRDTSFLC